MSISYTLAKSLKEAGFPLTTRWEVENNYRRPAMVQGEALPPFGAIADEIKNDFVLGKKNLADGRVAWEVSYYDIQLLKEMNQKMERSFTKEEREKISFHPSSTLYGSTPEEAVALLWLALHPKT